MTKPTEKPIKTVTDGFFALDETLRLDPKVDVFQAALIDSGELPGVRFDVEDAPAHALQLTLPGVSFTVDLVPAFETDDPDWLVIADREKCRWDKRSDVRAPRDKVAARNQKCQGRWVRQVRDSEHALRQDKPVKELVCGLVIESLAYDTVTSAITPQEAAAAIFTHGEKALTGRYNGLAQDDLTRKWSMLDRWWVVGFFARNHRLAVEAMECEANRDHAAASTVWRQRRPRPRSGTSAELPTALDDQLGARRDASRRFPSGRCPRRGMSQICTVP